MAGFRALRIGDVEPREWTGGEWLPLRHALGVGAFGVNAWRADAGREVIERHDESDYGHEELYVVLAGRVTFTVAGEDVDAPAGTALFVEDPSLERVGVAAYDGTLVLSVGAKRGQAFEVSAWEERHLGTN